MRNPNVSVAITPIKHPNFDWRVVVTRTLDGATREELVSGGQPIIDAVVARLRAEL